MMGVESMRGVSLFKRATILAPLACATPAVAAPTNLGFEEATLHGWTTNAAQQGLASVTPVLTNQDGGFATAAEGVLFGYVTVGLGKDTYTTLSQRFSLAAGGTISGWAGFLANDYLPYDDDAYVAVNGANLLSWTVADVGSYGSTGWVHFNFIAPAAGRYTLELGVANHGDDRLPSQAVIDGVQVTGAAVPEPASWAMMVLGFGFAGLALRSRTRAPTFA
jgi:hypothetical protein